MKKGETNFLSYVTEYKAKQDMYLLRAHGFDLSSNKAKDIPQTHNTK